MFTRRNITLAVLIAAIAISGFAFYMQDLQKVNLEPNEQHAGERDFTPDWIGIKRFDDADYEIAMPTDFLPDNRYLCTGYPDIVTEAGNGVDDRVSKLAEFTPDYVEPCTSYGKVDLSEAIAKPVDIGLCDYPDCIVEPYPYS